MAEKSAFAHIVVTPDEDEDIVVQAGLVEPEPDPEPEPEAPAPEPASAAPVPAARAARDDSFRPTTLEDLAGTKMPLAQKVVVVLAVLALAAFVAWYLLK